jgi:exodeoxyribonuclease V beta subunit
MITGREKEPLATEDDTIEATEVETAPAIEEPLAGMFAFPRGTGPGTCLHHIFEELDFSDLSRLAEIVRRKLRAFSIAGFDDIVCEMVHKVLNVALQPGLTLAGIKRHARLPELEFYFPIRNLTSERLADLLQDERLRFQPMSGFMKGFIDLVFEQAGKFYVVDWKSNWLGPDLESYTAKSMTAEMESKFYNLQLHIYVVALHRFLRARLPGYDYEKHFGGACYVFLRGVEPGRPELGVHRARPSAKFVESLSQFLGP